MPDVDDTTEPGARSRSSEPDPDRDPDRDPGPSRFEGPGLWSASEPGTSDPTEDDDVGVTRSIDELLAAPLPELPAFPDVSDLPGAVDLDRYPAARIFAQDEPSHDMETDAADSARDDVAEAGGDTALVDDDADGADERDEHAEDGSSSTGDDLADDERSGARSSIAAEERARSSYTAAGDDDPPARSRSGSFLRELPVLLVIALVLAFVLRTFVVQVFYIPSSSMEPTLQRDDRMVVEKITYRFREPRHGEVVVFEGESLGAAYADESAATRIVRGFGQFLGLVPVSARDFVKRVVALPGDEIEIVNGQVSVNGMVLDEPYVVYRDQSDFGPLVVPEGELFFLGDNRPNSSDSRSTLGSVPRDQVVGRSVLIIWPFDHAGRLTGTTHEVPPPAAGEPEADPDDP